MVVTACATTAHRWGKPGLSPGRGIQGPGKPGLSPGRGIDGWENPGLSPGRGTDGQGEAGLSSERGTCRCRAEEVTLEAPVRCAALGLPKSFQASQGPSRAAGHPVTEPQHPLGGGGGQEACATPVQPEQGQVKRPGRGQCPASGPPAQAPRHEEPPRPSQPCSGPGTRCHRRQLLHRGMKNNQHLKGFATGGSSQG